MRDGFLNILLDNIESGIILSDKNYNITQFNRKAEEILNEITGKVLEAGNNFFDFMNTHQVKSIQLIVERVIAQKSDEKAFGEYKNKIGADIYLEYHIIPLLDSDGSIHQLQFVINDITQQKIFESRLVNQAKNISNFIEKAQAIIIGVDTRGYITEWNEYAITVTGFKKNDVYAQRLTDKLVYQDHKDAFGKILEKAVQNKHERSYEVPFCTRNKSIKILLLSITQRISATGEVIGATLVGQDITELSEYRKTLENKVEERTKELKQSIDKEKDVIEMKNRFVSIASHEFRTPLHSIQYTANSLRQNKSLKQSKALKQLSDIEKHAERMLYMLDDVLTYSKSEPGKIKLILSKIPLIEFIDKICEEVCLSTKNTHTIRRTYQLVSKEIESDEKLLRNILINLLSNAIKYSPGKDMVYLEARENAGKLIVEIRDEGIGVPMEDAALIFEPFNRSKTAGSIPGTGLGLSIVKRATELLNGSIKLDSKVNLGTQITVTIPLR